MAPPEEPPPPPRLGSLGIDFGTSTLVVATAEGDEAPRTLALGRRQASSSELVVWSENGEPRVGLFELLGPREGGVRIRSLKRHFNCAGACKNPRGSEPWCRGDMHITTRHGRIPFDDVVRMALDEALPAAIERAGFDTALASTRVSAGCPVDWPLHPRMAMANGVSRAVARATRIGILREEPVLAAKMLRVRGGARPGRYLLIDIGGGSTDIAVVEMGESGGRIEVLACDGEAFLGGDDVDAILVDIACERAGVAPSTLAAEELVVLRLDVERAKHLLTALDDEDALAPLELQGRPVELRASDLERAWRETKFEAQLEKMVDRAVKYAIRRFGSRYCPPGAERLYGDDALWKYATGKLGPRLTQLTWDRVLLEVDAIVPVGGGTRLRQFERWRDRRLLHDLDAPLADRAGGRPRRLDLVGEASLGPAVEAIARGAALSVEVDGYSLFRLPFAVFARDTDGLEHTIVEPFSDRLPGKASPWKSTFHSRPELVVMDVRDHLEDFRPWTLPAGPVRCWFDELQRLHVVTSDGEQRELLLPWVDGTLRERVQDRARIERMRQQVLRDRIGAPLSYPDH